MRQDEVSRGRPGSPIRAGFARIGVVKPPVKWEVIVSRRERRHHLRYSLVSPRYSPRSHPASRVPSAPQKLLDFARAVTLPYCHIPDHTSRDWLTPACHEKSLASWIALPVPEVTAKSRGEGCGSGSPWRLRCRAQSVTGRQKENVPPGFTRARGKSFLIRGKQ